MNLKEVVQKVNDTVYEYETLSMPYSVADGDKLRVGIFAYKYKDSDDGAWFLTEVTQRLEVDLADGHIYEKSAEGIILPIKVKAGAKITREEYKKADADYHESLEELLSNPKTEAGRYREAAKILISPQLLDLYKAFGALYLD